MPTFYTVGHSTHSIPAFLAILNSAGVELVADVRAFPGSRTNPQFGAEALRVGLAGAGIEWRHLPSLGGRRRNRRGLPSPNDFWTNASFRDYADYAAGPEFRRGLDELREIGHDRTCAIMCSEAVWWRCHRRIIADYLLAAGEPVVHILTAHKLQPAQLTPAARRQADGTLVYPLSATDGHPSALRE